MTLNGAIMQLVEMRENSMMPVFFKPYLDKVIETISECEESSAQPTHSNTPNTLEALDCISRQAAIDALMEDFKRVPTNAIRAKTVIEQLPSVQPERDVPVKPIETTDTAWGIPNKQAVCPKCDYYLGHVAFLGDYKGKRITYCETCGQAIDARRYTFGNDEFSLEDAYHNCKLVFDGITDDDSFQEADTGLILYYANEIIYALQEALEGKDTNVPTNDCISRKDAIDALWGEREKLDSYMDECLKKGLFALRSGTKAERNRIEEDIEIITRLPSAQPTQPNTFNTLKALDCISRQQVINALCDNCDHVQAVCPHYPCKQYTKIEQLPSVQPTISGYDIRHLELIASVLQKENLPPERVAEALTDIGRIVAIVKKEFEESLRKAVEQCTI